MLDYIHSYICRAVEWVFTQFSVANFYQEVSDDSLNPRTSLIMFLSRFLIDCCCRSFVMERLSFLLCHSKAMRSFWSSRPLHLNIFLSGFVQCTCPFLLEYMIVVYTTCMWTVVADELLTEDFVENLNNSLCIFLILLSGLRICREGGVVD